MIENPRAMSCWSLRSLMLLMATSAMIVGAAAAHAAAGGMPPGPAAQTSPMPGQSLEQRLPELPDTYKLSHWIGKSVRNQRGEELGTVDEVVMDDFGRLRYVIIKSERLASEQPGHLIAVPMGMFEYPLSREQYLVLNTPPRIVPGASPAGGQRGQASRSPGMAMQPYAATVPRTSLSNKQERLFERLDRNADAVIERQEARSNGRLAKAFNRIDTYNDGRITRSEFAAFEIGKPAGGARTSEIPTPQSQWRMRSLWPNLGHD